MSSYDSRRDGSYPKRRPSQYPGNEVMNRSHYQKPDSDSYSSIIFTNLPNMHVDDIYEQLYDKYIQYRYFNIQITSQRGQTVAYLNFEDSGTAAEAYKETLDSISMFDGLVEVAPVVRGQRIPAVKVRAKDDTRKRVQQTDHCRVQQTDHCRVQQTDHCRVQQTDHYRAQPNEPCRVLFVGNLNPKVEAEDITGVFSKYGYVEGVQFRGKDDGMYCFVTFADVNMAQQAKNNTHGLRFGRYNCLIGYGRPIPSNCLYIGNVPNNHDVATYFQRYGDIIQQFWPQGTDFGYVLFQNLSSAQEAYKEMKGFIVPSTKQAIQLDFARESHMNQSFADKIIEHRSSLQDQRFSPNPESPVPAKRSYCASPPKNRISSNTRFSSGFSNFNVTNDSADDNYSFKRPFICSPVERVPPKTRFSSDNCLNDCKETEDETVEIPLGSPMSPRPEKVEDNYSLSSVSEEETELFCPPKTLGQVKDSGEVWNGAFMLKNSQVPVSFRFVTGNSQLVDYFLYKHTILTNGVSDKQREPVLLSIVHRLRLDPEKLGEVQRRIEISDGGYCVLAAFPPTSGGGSSLSNLVNYFCDKNAAAVVVISVSYSIGGTEKQSTAVLHAFPKCDFARKLLCPAVSEQSFDSFDEDFLTVVIVGSNVEDLTPVILPVGGSIRK